MPTIRSEHYPQPVLKAWLDANGVRWPIPIDEPIIVHGNYATARCADVRWEHVNNPAQEKPGWRDVDDPDLFDIFGEKKRTWRIRTPLRTFL